MTRLPCGLWVNSRCHHHWLLQMILQSARRLCTWVLVRIVTFRSDSVIACLHAYVRSICFCGHKDLQRWHGRCQQGQCVVIVSHLKPLVTFRYIDSFYSPSQLPGSSHKDTGWNSFIGHAAVRNNCSGWCCSAIELYFAWNQALYGKCTHPWASFKASIWEIMRNPPLGSFSSKTKIKRKLLIKSWVIWIRIWMD